MEDRLRVGFASIEDAASVRSWSGIPAHILAMLPETPGVGVELLREAAGLNGAARKEEMSERTRG